MAVDSPKIDSLKLVLLTMEDNQSKAEAILAISLEYLRENNLDSTEAYTDKLMELSNRIGYQLGIADAYYNIGRIKMRRGEFAAAIAPLKKFFELAGPYQDPLRLARGHYAYGMTLRQTGINDSAIIRLKTALAYFSSVGDLHYTLAIMNDIGGTYRIMDEYDSASVYFLNASSICVEHGLENYLGNIYNNLGKALNYLGSIDEALRYYHLSLDINRKYNKSLDVGINLVNIAGVYLERGKTDSAEVLFLEALDLFKNHGTPIHLADIYNNLGEINEVRNKPREALSYYQQALAIFRESQYSVGMTIVLKNMGDAYSQLGMYQRAQEVLDSSLVLARSSGQNTIRRDAYKAMALNYHLSGDNAKAYEYQLMYTDLHDSVFSMEQSEMINKLKLQYEKEKDQTQILELENKNLTIELELRKKTSQRNGMLYAGLGIVALAIFLILYFRQRAKKDKIIAEQRILQLEEEKKLMAARLIVEGQEEERKRIAQDLHDGIGVLLSATKLQFTTIRDKSPENRELIDKATQLLEQASGDVRKISQNMMPGLLTRMGLYEAVEDLMETVNETEGIEAVFSFTGEKERLPENKEIMLYRIIQELVNNTLKHAGARSVSLRMDRQADQLLILYVDDGRGFDPASLVEDEKAGLGLRSIRSRVGFLNGTMTLDSKPGEGTHYSLSIPV